MSSNLFFDGFFLENNNNKVTQIAASVEFLFFGKSIYWWKENNNPGQVLQYLIQRFLVSAKLKGISQD